MEFLNLFLPVVLYTVSIVLITILIVIGLRFLRFLDKLESICDNIERKVNSLDSVFTAISKTADSISGFKNSFISGAGNMFYKIFRKKKKEDSYYE